MLLLIDNYDSFTWNLVQALGVLRIAAGDTGELRVVRHDEVRVADIDGIDAGRAPSHIIISPGPCSPAEAGISVEVITRFAGRVPILGVCLGHQCLAAAYGMLVVRHDPPIHGKTSQVHHDGRGVFAGLASPFTAMRYHSLVVDPDSVPPPPHAGEDGWEVSAWTNEDDGRGGRRKVVMGLRRVFVEPARAPLEGVQFHPESFMTPDGPALLANFLAMGRGWAREGWGRYLPA